MNRFSKLMESCPVNIHGEKISDEEITTFLRLCISTINFAVERGWTPELTEISFAMVLAKARGDDSFSEGMRVAMQRRGMTSRQHPTPETIRQSQA